MQRGKGACTQCPPLLLLLPGMVPEPEGQRKAGGQQPLCRPVCPHTPPPFGACHLCLGGQVRLPPLALLLTPRHSWTGCHPHIQTYPHTPHTRPPPHPHTTKPTPTPPTHLEVPVHDPVLMDVAEAVEQLPHHRLDHVLRHQACSTRYAVRRRGGGGGREGEVQCWQRATACCAAVTARTCGARRQQQQPRACGLAGPAGAPQPSATRFHSRTRHGTRHRYPRAVYLQRKTKAVAMRMYVRNAPHRRDCPAGSRGCRGGT